MARRPLLLLALLLATATALHVQAPGSALRSRAHVAMMADVRLMTTKQLKKELKQRGLATSGGKSALERRLSAAQDGTASTAVAEQTSYSAEDREKLMAARFPDGAAGVVVPTTPPPASAVPPPASAAPPAADTLQQPVPPMASALLDAPIGAAAAAPEYQREQLDIGPPAEPPPPSAEKARAAELGVEWLGPFGGLVEGTQLARPSYLDGTLAGDAGFDPLGFCVNGLPNGMPSSFSGKPSESQLRANLMWMREAEVKHARLAMLAVAGWPLAELWHGPLCRLTGLPFALDATQGRSPSLLNGHLLDSAVFLGLATLGMAAVEVATMDNVYGLTRKGMTVSKSGNGLVQVSYVPGDLGFDPLSLYGLLGNSIPAMTELRMQNDPSLKDEWDAYQRKEMEAWEIYHGRGAMLGITGFAVQEFATGVPIVDQTPGFFTPFWEQLAPGAVASLGL